MKILVSSCLIDKRCRWHGRKAGYSTFVRKLLKEQNVEKLIDVCPELLGGLPCPRLPVKRLKGRVFETIADKKKRSLYTGRDVTEFFLKGANRTLEIALKEKPDLCILCQWSPSCDLTGLTGSLLVKNGFNVINTF